MAIEPTPQYKKAVFDDLLSPRSDPPAHHVLTDLNDEQRRAVETTEGPLLILAGAGTGKTRVLTTRFAYILLKKKAWPEQILAVTFTNKAAREMRERISGLLDKPVEGLWLGTFHALCARMLRRHAQLVDLERNFTVLDSDDQVRLLKQVIANYPVDTKRWPPAHILNQIQQWKDRALLPEDITPAQEGDVAQGYGRSIYTDYQVRLRALNACDFGDLMLHMVTIFHRNPDVLAQYHQRFRYIMVDEYQDTNSIQYLWLRLLARRDDGIQPNIACVGDDDQSIYSWRGADIDNILRFEKDFPGATVIRLERNYRSTPHILAAASGIIAHNEGRLGKTLHAGDHSSSGEKIQVIHVPDSDSEARLVGQMIQELNTQGNSYGNIALLMRASFQTRAFEEIFVRMGLPYQIIGGQRFYERAEIRDSTAYMRTLIQPTDDLAFERIVNTPKRGFGAAALTKLREEARAQGISLQQALERRHNNNALKGKSGEALTILMDALHAARKTLDSKGHVEAAQQLLEESGYFQMWRDDRSPDAPGRLDNLQELLRDVGEFPSLEAFLEHIALVMDTDAIADDGQRISLMTLHASKGLEFDTVFLPGWEESLFPSQRSLDENGNKALEEERRLAYVGLTRARKRAIISHVSSRRIYANWQDCVPSRFLDELPDAHIQKTEPRRPSSSFGRTFGSAATHGGWASAHSIYDMKSAKVPALGALVRHTRFGLGTIIAVEGSHLTINFENGGSKNVMADYIEIIS